MSFLDALESFTNKKFALETNDWFDSLDDFLDHSPEHIPGVLRELWSRVRPAERCGRALRKIRRISLRDRYIGNPLDYARVFAEKLQLETPLQELSDPYVETFWDIMGTAAACTFYLNNVPREKWAWSKTPHPRFVYRMFLLGRNAEQISRLDRVLPEEEDVLMLIDPRFAFSRVRDIEGDVTGVSPGAIFRVVFQRSTLPSIATLRRLPFRNLTHKFLEPLLIDHPRDKLIELFNAAAETLHAPVKDFLHSILLSLFYNFVHSLSFRNFVQNREVYHEKWGSALYALSRTIARPYKQKIPMEFFREREEKALASLRRIRLLRCL